MLLEVAGVLAYEVGGDVSFENGIEVACAAVGKGEAFGAVGRAYANDVVVVIEFAIVCRGDDVDVGVVLVHPFDAVGGRHHTEGSDVRRTGGLHLVRGPAQ